MSTVRSALLVLVSSACVPGPAAEWASASTEAAPPPMRLASGALHLQVPGLMPGETAAFRISGAAAGGEVELYVGHDGESCPAGGPCLELDGGVVLASGTASADGTAELTFTVPPILEDWTGQVHGEAVFQARQGWRASNPVSIWELGGGCLGGDVDLSQASAVLSRRTPEDPGDSGDQVGWSLAGGRDLTGDGFPDLVVAAPMADDGGEDAGIVFVVRAWRCRAT